MNQNQIAVLLGTSKQNIGQHINNMLEEKGLEENSVGKNYLTTAAFMPYIIQISKKQ